MITNKKCLICGKEIQQPNFIKYINYKNEEIYFCWKCLFVGVIAIKIRRMIKNENNDFYR